MNMPQSTETAATFGTRHPYWAVLLTTLTMIILMGAAGTVLYLQSKNGAGTAAPASSGYVTTNLRPVFMVFPFFALWLAYLFFLRGNWRDVSPRRLSELSGRDWLPFLIPLGVVAVQIINAIPSLNRPAAQIGYFLLFTALVAFVEEGIYRGLFLKWLRPKGFNVAVIVSTLAFTLTHTLNLLGGQSVATTALQLLFALLFGLLAALLRFRAGTLLPLMAWHMAFDFTGLNGTRQGENLTLVALECLLMLGGAIWLWREREEARATPNALSSSS